MKPRPAAQAGLGVLPLVGRKPELALIASLLKDAEKGAGRTLIVSGEGGVGKTRILTTAAEQAERDGWNVVVGRAYAVETGIPYALFSDALLPSIRKLDPGALSVLTRGGLAELSYLFPALGSHDERGRATAGIDASDLKARLLWNFTQFLGRFAGKQPLCLILENLQWADASSLELFHFVARQLFSHRIALLASYNEAEREANPVLRTTEQSLLSLGVAAHCRVGPLTHGDIATLLEEVFEVDGDSVRQFTALLYGWTRGNPFFVEETLKSLCESGVLRHADGRWTGWEVESLNLPPTVRDAVASRMERLSAPARDLASLISVVGARVSFDQLRALSPLDENALADAIDELQNHRVLEEVQGPQGASYDFAHPILQQVTYKTLGTPRARLLHAKIAESLESYYGRRARSHAGELAFHFTHSQSLAPKAIVYLSEAGRIALETYANREAATYLASALEMLDLIDEPPVERDEIILRLARARQRLGDYDDALSLWSAARDNARDRSDHTALARIEHRMGLACYWSGRFEDALDHYGEGLRAAESGGDREVIVRLHLAKGICFQEIGRRESAKEELERALAAAEQTGSKQLLARAHRALLLLYAWTGPADLALAHGKQGLALAESSGEAMLEWTAHWGMGVLAGLSGNASDLVHHIAECQRLEEQLRSPLLPLWTAELYLQYVSSVGDWDAGIDTGERTIALARALRQRTLLPRLLVWTGLIYLWRHQLEKARAYFDEAWTLSGAGVVTEGRVDVPTVAPAHMGLAAYHLETDNCAEAIKVGEAGLAVADRSGYVAWSLQWLLPVVGEAALWIRDFARAEKHLARMREDAVRLSSRYGLAIADACEGMLLVFRDSNPAGAIPLLRKAAETLEAIPYPDSASRVRRVLSGALRDSGDREGALRELHLAHDVFARLGAQGELDAVRAELRKLGARPPSRTIATGASGLTGRELEIARMVALRKSNKEIGAVLDISSRTVSTHLSNVFAKVGVSSRGELADFVRDNGLAEE
ncbi:MAG TPA: AAA family ATPase [Gemmatimonadaceae bacterium]|nr:AAA family ATPase [Gemmatimonadaceae bacterium]